MRHAALGASGPQVSRICLGTMLFGSTSDEGASHRMMDTALELGIDFFDVSNSYPSPPDPQTMGRSEEIVGRWLKGRRDAVVLSTKFGSKFQSLKGSRRDVIQACEASLRRLQTDRIDVYWFHQPTLETPFEETLEALDRLLLAGKILYVGASNFEAWHLALLLLAASGHPATRIAAIQPRYNLLHRQPERDLIPLGASAGMGVVPFNPLGAGVLAGRYQRSAEPPPESRFTWGELGRGYRTRYWSEPAFDVADVVSQVAQQEGVTPSRVAVAWLLSRPALTSVIVGASRPEQLRDSAAGAEAILSAYSLALLDEVSRTFI
ncbi:MAG: aldo/keto reductase [Candidatus Dormibacteraeota bacterium]|uniref:Aldo/keto reductase n=1 Tax=Candidatus Dormiibacter inghamiae TaxID=3127013 RepID=A0A934KAH3_9BACT|nr:aldo/keto reductase [Candidatus Dormibacteraeota bacterium]MBJ7605285.1 aldo/keto reductase [Candidatus Dormibacteraeota bacterium]